MSVHVVIRGAALTDRERLVLGLMVEGMTGPEMASRLVLSRRTIETHRRTLLHKLGARNMVDAVRIEMERRCVALMNPVVAWEQPYDTVL